MRMLEEFDPYFTEKLDEIDANYKEKLAPSIRRL